MLAPTSWFRRSTQLLLGLVVFGFGLGLVVLGDHGLPGWDVFHQGLARHTPLSIGTAVIAVGAVLLLVMVWLREPIGIGTIANVVVIGLALDGTLWVIDEPSAGPLRAALTLIGPIVVALGSGWYLGVRLSSGPRDGIMTAMAARGVTLWHARFGIEAAALAAGAGLGGTVGWGTIWFLVVIGPSVQFFLRHLALDVEPGGAWTRA